MAQEYFVAASTQEALAYLATHRGQAQLVAGGTQLMPLVERGEATPLYLVDISGICTLKRIVQADSYVVIGSATTLSKVVAHPLVQTGAPLLIEAVQQMDMTMKLDSATLGGLVATARSTSELSVALVTLEAEAEITNLTGAQWLPLHALLSKNGFSRVDSTSEIVTALRFESLASGQGTALGRLASGTADGCPSLVLAFMLALDPTRSRMEWVCVVTSSTHGAPAHLSTLEEALARLPVNDPRIPGTIEELLPEQLGAGGLWPSLAYETDRKAAGRLGRDTFMRALERALADEPAGA